MTVRHPERLTPRNRLRAARDFEALRGAGRPFRGRFCVLVAATCPGEASRVGFIASKRTVGNAPRRNRARRRLREIVRRRWPRVPAHGFMLLLIATARTVAAPHQELASEVERLLAAAGALRPYPVEPA